MAASEESTASAPDIGASDLNPKLEVHRSLLRNQVVNVLRDQLTTGVLSAGQHLMEQHLADALQISRGPVREAFLQLEAEGLIVSDPHRGFRVIRPNMAFVVELYDYRAMLEGWAAERVARDPDPLFVESLLSLVDDMDEIAEQGDIARLLHKDMEFHQRIVEAAGHSRLMESWLRVKAQVVLVAHLTSVAILTDLRDPRALHSGIASAIHDGDPARARAEVMEHILRVPVLLAQRIGDDWETFGSAVDD